LTVVGGAAAASLAVSDAARVYAHAGLEGSSPAANSVLAEPPSSIELDFDEPIDVSLTSIRLIDGTSSDIELGDVQPGADSSQVGATVPPLADGTYLVLWRTTSVDGHVIEGSFGFQIGEGAGGPTVDEILASVGGSGSARALSAVAGVVRFVGLLSLLTLGGALVVSTLGSVPGASGLARRAAVLVVASAIAGFAVYAARAGGGGLPQLVSPRLWAEALGSRIGRVQLARAVVGGLLCSAVWHLDNRWSQQQIAATATWLATAFTWSAGGHPAASVPSLPWIALDVLHLAASAGWFGCIAVIALGGRQWRDSVDAEVVARRFSSVATVSFPVALVSGSVQVVGLTDVNTLTDTRWGRLLVVKIGAVVVLASLAATARTIVRRAAGSVMRLVVFEAVLGTALVGLTAALIGTPPRPPVDVSAVPADAEFRTTVSAAGVVVEVTIGTVTVGTAQVHFVVTPPAGNLIQIESLAARVSLPDAQIPDAPIAVQLNGVNHYQGSVTFTVAGDWTLEIIVAPDPTNSVLLTAVVPVR
jgi:copper transport protein